MCLHIFMTIFQYDFNCDGDYVIWKVRYDGYSLVLFLNVMSIMTVIM
jgi:hypothetical protein